MAGALPKIGYHISKKELLRGKRGYFLSLSLRGCLEPASQACRLLWIVGPGSEVKSGPITIQQRIQLGLYIKWHLINIHIAPPANQQIDFFPSSLG